MTRSTKWDATMCSGARVSLGSIAMQVFKRQVLRRVGVPIHMSHALRFQKWELSLPKCKKQCTPTYPKAGSRYAT